MNGRMRRARMEPTGASAASWQPEVPRVRGVWARIRRRARAAVGAAGLLVVGFASVAHAGVALSLDATALLSGEVVQDEDVIYASNSGTALSALLPPIPSQAEVAALHLNGTQILFAVDTACVIEGITVEPRDVSLWDGAVLSTTLDGSVVGIPDGVRIDALALTANSNLLLSFDQPTQVGSLFVADEDLVRIFPSPLIVFDGSAEGIDPSLDLNGASTAPNGLGLLSFDGSGAVGGIDFDDEDVLGWDPTTGNFSLFLDASAVDPAFLNADVTAVPEPKGPVVLGLGIIMLVTFSIRLRRSKRSRYALIEPLPERAESAQS